MANKPRTLHRVAVVGRGRFPIDMLRYDAARPTSSDDSSAIESEQRGLRLVRLLADHPPTVGRWASFGWTVISHDNNGIARPQEDVDSMAEHLLKFCA